MFYETAKSNHGLPHDPLKAIVAPRPIGWISSLSRSGIPNLAPYSFFNLFSTDPAIVGFASGTRKDSQRNIEETGEFVYNFASVDLAEQVNLSSSSVAAEVDEFKLAGLNTVESNLIGAPRVAEARAHFECKYLRTVLLNDVGIEWSLILGEVIGVHIEDRFIIDGLIDTSSMAPLSRLGYLDYASLGEVFSKPRPK
ncbi:MAG: flavin reductase family protein [Pseudomonadota bacterium]